MPKKADGRGRPPKPETLLARKLALELKAWGEQLASYPGYSDAMGASKELADGFAKEFVDIRRILGLSSNTISNQDIADLLGLLEEPDPECEARNLPAETYTAWHTRLSELHTKLTENVPKMARKGGQKIPPETALSKIIKMAPDLEAMLAGGTPYKVVNRELDKRQIPVVSESTLRRYRRSKSVNISKDKK